MVPHTEQLHFRIYDNDESEPKYSVDVGTLTALLQGMQKLINLLAEQESNGKLDKTVQKLMTIHCLVPQKGSYSIPVEFGCLNGSLLDFDDLVSAVYQSACDCIGCVYSGSMEKIKGYSSLYRKKILKTIRDMLPKSGSSWNIGISGKDFSERIFTNASRANASRLLKHESAEENQDQYLTVTGYLVAMDFEKHSLTMKYPPTGTELECFYQDDLEVELFENRKGMIQVTGNVTYDPDKTTPKKITDVESIEPLDISEFILKSVPLDESALLVFKKPITLIPEQTESMQYLTVRHPFLGIDVMAQTRDELWEWVLDDLRDLWETCVKVDDDQLGDEFVQIKKNLMKSIDEVPYGNS